MAVAPSERWNIGLNTFVILSHTALALVATFASELIREFPVYLRLTVLILYVAGAWALYSWLQRRQHAARDLEAERWRRFYELSIHVLSTLNEFLKSRYKVNRSLAAEIDSEVNAGHLPTEVLISLLEEADKQRREQIRAALTEIALSLPQDAFKRPEQAEMGVQDVFKVSFYVVGSRDDGTEVLQRKYRYYPNEAQPRTKEFLYGEGAAGIAWKTKQTVVCELGGEDPRFQDMWEGGGQKGNYASMICVPAIEDIPAEKITRVYGVLTVDTRVRRGYFEGKLAQFWGELFQPVCSLLLYCDKLENATKSTVAALGNRGETSPTQIAPPQSPPRVDAQS